ncbi:hypothetical protein B0H14DRAFT_2562499 [Mycena olivaceomarginata]|nr:hypothetical protein B0H14DRAFT_2562499 [Mycena olivaceomarginata]
MALQEGTQACKLPNRHTETQRKYREKNLEATRAKARDRMKRMHARRTPEEVEKASRQRKEGDADYRELLPPVISSTNTGNPNFSTFYFPLYAQLGQKHLPGLKFTILIKCNCEKGACYELDVGDSLPSEMVCRLSVEHNGNYKNNSGHDSNTQKFWFLVFGKGLYTKKTDADAAAGGDNGVHIFNTRVQASQAWARHCHRRYSAGCYETKDPVAHQSDADSNTDKDTEDPAARAAVLHRVARQPATAPRKAPKTAVKAEVVIKSECLTSTARAVSARAVPVPVKRAAAAKAEPASPKKLPLYADGDDSDDDLFNSDSSVEVPLASCAKSARSSRPASCTSSALSGLEEDEDMLMPLSNPVTPMSPTMSSVSLLATSSATTSNFSLISGVFRATAPHAAGPSTTHATAHMFNRRTGVLYDDPKSVLAEKNPGESMQVVDTREIIPLISGLGTSSNLLYNRKTQVLYDNLTVAVEERKPGESMQVVKPDAVVPWISGLGR